MQRVSGELMLGGYFSTEGTERLLRTKRRIYGNQNYTISLEKMVKSVVKLCTGRGLPISRTTAQVTGTAENQ